MRAVAILICWLLSTGVAAAQEGRSGLAAAVALVQEFKGLAEAKERSAQQFLADYETAVKHLVERMYDRNLSTRYRLEARDDLEAVCLRAARPGADLDRAALCSALLPWLSAGGEDAPHGTIIRMLEYVGRDEAVEPLAKVLDDKDEQDRERARQALEANPSDRAGEKLRQALYKAVDSTWRVGLINSLGARRDEGSIEHLGKVLKDPDQAVALAAAAALGRIGGAAAIEALNSHRLLALGPLRDEIADALFRCAEEALAAGDTATAVTIYRKAYENPLEPRRSRVAALRRLVAAQGEKATPMVVGLLSSSDEAILPVAMELAREVPGREATRAFAAMLDRADTAERKTVLLDLLGARGDPVAREAVLGAIRGQTWAPQQKEAVRVAVIKALAGVGNEEDVGLLVRLATMDLKGREEERKWAKWSLQRLRGPKVDEALLSALAAGGDPAARREVMTVLADRGVADAVPQLLSVLGEKDPLMRQAALQALGDLGDKTTLAPLAKLLADAKGSSEAYVVERAIVEVCSRCDDEDAAAGALASAMDGGSEHARAALMRICGRIGGGKALEIVAAGAGDPDAEVRQQALRAMSHFRDPRAADTLLKIAATAGTPELRTEALQGYIRLMRYLDQAPEKKLWMYLRVLDLAVRPEEKKLALSGLGDVKTLAGMKMAMEYLDFPEVRPEAEETTYRIARHLCEMHPKEVVDAMQRLLRTSENENTTKEAKRILALAEEALKKAQEKP